jgi:hypothetical protein
LRLRAPGPMAFMRFVFDVPEEDAPSWLARWQQMTLNADPRLSFIIYVNKPAANRVRIRARLISSLDEPSSEAAFNRLVDLGHLSGQPFVEFVSFHQVADHMWPPTFYGERSARYASDMLGDVVAPAVWAEVFGAMAQAGDINTFFSLEALGGAIDEVPNAFTAYAHRSTAKFKVQYRADYPSGGAQGPTDAALNKLTSALRPHGTGGAFYNYPEVDRPNWGQAYFGENFERLKQVKRQHDPGNVFNHPLSIPVA